MKIKKRIKKIFMIILLIIVALFIIVSELPIATGNYSISNLIYGLIGIIAFIVMGIYWDKIKSKRKF